MALAFDANYYLSTRPDVFNAFVKTAGATGQTWAQFAEAHYNTFGRFEGSNPNATFNTNQYLAANPDVAAAGVNPFTHFLNFGAKEGRAPSATFPSFASFDEKAYLAANPDLGAAGITTKGAAYEHFVKFGQFEARPGAPAVDTGVPGQTFTLTEAVGENVVGTADNDEFTAVLDTGATDDSTLNIGDRIDGAGGNDTLNLFLTGNANTGLPGGVNVRNVETVNLISDGTATLQVGTTTNALNFGGAFSGAQQIWQENEANNVAGVSASQTAGFRNIDDLDVDAAFTGASGNVALDVTGDTVLDFGGTGTAANVLRTVNISGDAGDSLTLSDAATTASVRNVNLSLESEDGVTVDVDGATALQTFNAAGSSADITVDFDLTVDATTPANTVLGALESITLGSGDDDVELTNFSGQELTVDLGAGDDDLTIGGDEAGLNVTLGAGFDEFISGTLANITTDDADDFADDIIQITDFNGAQDFLNIDTGISFAGLTNQQSNALNTALNGENGSLLNGLEYLADQGAGYYSFEFKGSTYIYNGDGDGEFDAGDGLLQLVGFTGDLTDANFNFA